MCRCDDWLSHRYETAIHFVPLPHTYLLLNLGVGPSTFTRYAESGITPIGVIFGLAGSMTTGLHVVVIKRSLVAVGNSAMELSWYSNVLTSVLLIPLIIVIGETKEFHRFLTRSTPDEIQTFVVGTLITGKFASIEGRRSSDARCRYVRVLDLRCWHSISEDHLPDDAYGLLGRQRCLTDCRWSVALRGHHHCVRSPPSLSSTLTESTRPDREPLQFLRSSQAQFGIPGSNTLRDRPKPLLRLSRYL